MPQGVAYSTTLGGGLTADVGCQRCTAEGLALFSGAGSGGSGGCLAQAFVSSSGPAAAAAVVTFCSDARAVSCCALRPAEEPGGGALHAFLAAGCSPIHLKAPRAVHTSAAEGRAPFPTAADTPVLSVKDAAAAETAVPPDPVTSHLDRPTLPPAAAAAAVAEAPPAPAVVCATACAAASIAALLNAVGATTTRIPP